eukprot:1061430-Rhodomonas_salina.1
MLEEIRARIDVGLRAFGKRGVLDTLKDQTFEEACWRDDEWVPTEALGMNSDVQDPIPAGLWNILLSVPPSVDVLRLRPVVLEEKRLGDGARHTTALEGLIIAHSAMLGLSCSLCNPVFPALVAPVSSPQLKSRWGNDGTGQKDQSTTSFHQ